MKRPAERDPTELASFPRVRVQGEPKSTRELLPLVYDELRRLAAQRLAKEAPGQTLQATALVHEAYLRLVGESPDRPWDGRGHFFAAAAEAMRRILVEHARRRHRLKRGGDRARVDLDRVELAAPGIDADVLALDEALEQLARIEPVKAQVVQLRVFAGLTVGEVAEVLGVNFPGKWRSFFGDKWHGVRPDDRHRWHNTRLHNITSVIGRSSGEGRSPIGRG
jgi:RNA polymerase sigma factor (TIGR02999 family)